MRAAMVLASVLVASLAGCMVDEPATEPTIRTTEVPEPTVDFHWSPEEPRVGESVSFEPFGSVPETAAIEAWSWDFGDGATSDQGAPLHRFGDVGLFPVQVRMSLDDGQVATVSHVVDVISGNVPDTREQDALAAGPPVILHEAGEVAVRFQYLWSLEPDEVSWEFGDGATSEEPGPNHAYASAGTFTVHLRLRIGSVVREARIDLAIERPAIQFRLSSVGVEGAEPSIGITSSGCMFYAAFERVMRSCDQGRSWQEVEDLLSEPTTSDPYLWVDPETDRVFNVQMLDLACTWIAWSDDDGASWLGNPWDCGPIPVNDHIKLGTGPWTAAGYGLLGGSSPSYEQAVYFCYNKLVSSFCYTSFDGGATFPVGGEIVGLAGAGGLHGAITTAPDGTVYVPPRVEQPTVLISKDNGLTWQSRSMGRDVGTPEPRKNSEVATDRDSNAYHVWIGGDGGVYMARSLDSGGTWDAASLRVSPAELVSATFPQVAAGDPGRIAVAYLASDDAGLLGMPDLDGDPWDGNPHTAPAGVAYDLYVTFATDALDADPGFLTVKVTPDPVQLGSICISSADCRDIGGSNRNLLDFNDLSIDRDGRIYIAYADGCTAECVRSWQDRGPEDSRDRAAMVALLDTGPSLYDAVAYVPPLG